MDHVAAFVVTFRRDRSLRTVLASLAEQTDTPVAVLVVDNGSSAHTAAVCDEFRDRLAIDYVASDNVGPAGGTALAMEELPRRHPEVSWLLRIDDDRPLPSPTFLAEHLRRAVDLVTTHPTTGIVGRDGAVWDWRRARLRPRPVDRDPAPVDYVRTGYFPLYRVAMVREVGTFRSDLFFGMTEVEYGLRVGQAGWLQWAVGRDPVHSRPRVELDDWRRYYSIRNTTVLLKEQGRPAAAWRLGLARGIGRPLIGAMRSPRRALRGLRLGAMALRDARRGRMGLVVRPVPPRRGGAELHEMPLS